MVSPSRKRAAVEQLESEFDVSERRACLAVDQPRSSQRYQLKVRDDEAALVKRMLALACEHPRYGYRFITAKLPLLLRSPNCLVHCQYSEFGLRSS